MRIVAVLPSERPEGDPAPSVRQSVDLVAQSFEEAVRNAAVQYPNEAGGKPAHVIPHAVR